MARWEWLIIEGLVLALLVWELLRTRRAIRRDRAAAKQRGPDADT